MGLSPWGVYDHDAWTRGNPGESNHATWRQTWRVIMPPGGKPGESDHATWRQHWRV